MKHSKLFKYILISSLFTLSILSSACAKKKMSAQEINESIQAENQAKKEAEEKTLQESKEAQQKEDQEKFHVKSEDEKLEESRQAIIESEAPALKEEALKTVDNLYAVDSDDPDKIKQAKEEAKQKIEEGFDNLTPESDVYVQMAEATDIDSDEVINLAELDDYSWNTIATNIYNN